MEQLVHHFLQLFDDVIKYWGGMTIIFGLLGGIYHRLTKRQEEQLKLLRKEIKRLELLHGIDHNYDLQIVSAIFDEYESLGGNHYAHEQFENYKKLKEKEGEK